MRKGSGPIDLLKEEHRAALLKLELIERSLHYLCKAPGETLPERIEIEKSLLKDLSLSLEREIGPHFRKEEEALFPILAEYIGKEHGPIEAMLHEHDKIWSAFLPWKRSLAELCRSADRIDDEARKAVLDPGLRIVQLIRLHINKEDLVLFKVSESSLTKEEKNRVTARMRAINEELGKGP